MLMLEITGNWLGGALIHSIQLELQEFLYVGVCGCVSENTAIECVGLMTATNL
jgi:lipid A disaccharide synthetase